MAGRRLPKKAKRLSESHEIPEEDILKEIPPRLVSCLMPFQKEGVLFAVRKGGRCLIADEMGLGKTLQAIAVASYFQSEWPVLIIVPSSLRYAWIEELEKWLPDILPSDINLIQGGFDTAGIAEARITIVTYGLLSASTSGMVKEALRARQFKVAICDESHFFKNSQTQCCKAVSSLLTSASRCILLSGTPALAKPSELFTQLDALLPGKFGSFWSFTKKYCAGHWQHFGRRRHWKADGASNLEDLQQRLQSVMIRREKSAVLTQLPPKQRQKILFALKDSQTKKEILSSFEDLKPMLKRSKSSLAAGLVGEGQAGGPQGADSASAPDTNILSRIQQIYNLTGEAKIGPARDYVQMLCENASLKFLVFAYHHAMMDGLQQTLWDRKVKFIRIDGHTKPVDRQLYVKQFQSDPETRVALLSILAAGVGLTFTAATLVVFAELYWTPGVMVQCEDRAHRIGQTSTVPVHYLVARETMDEWVWSAVCRKTMVTTKALMGKSRALKADAGDKYQVELLSAADAYTPVDNADIDVSQLILSQRPNDQKSIMDFFGSQRGSSQTGTQPSPHCTGSQATDSRKARDTATPSAAGSSGRRRLSPTTPQRTSSSSQSSSVCHLSQDPVVVDSSGEELDSVCHTPSRPLVSLSPATRSVKTDVKHTQSRGQTKTGSSSKKRKCVAATDSENNSDSEFVDSQSSLSHSVKKRKRREKSTPSSPTRVGRNGVKNDRGGRLEVSERQQDSATKGHHMWACPSCTFSNSGLLPFCEMCETPRKGKGQSVTLTASVPETLSETAQTPSQASPVEDLELISPVCSSTQAFKPRNDGKVHRRTEGADEDDETFLKSSSRHGAKRNLAFGLADSQTNAEKTGDSLAQTVGKSVSREKNGDAICCPEPVSEKSQRASESLSCKRNSEDTDTVCFKLNSSFEEDNDHTSPPPVDSGQEKKQTCDEDADRESDQGEQETAIASDEETEHTASFSSSSSTPCNRTADVTVTERVCSDDENGQQEDGETDLFTRRKVPTGALLCASSDLPVIKCPRRKSFMLGTPENTFSKFAYKKHSVKVPDSSKYSSGKCDETGFKDLQCCDANSTSEADRSDFTAVKRKPIFKRSNCGETNNNSVTTDDETSSGSDREAGQESTDEAGEQTEESAAMVRDTPQGCDKTEVSRKTSTDTDKEGAAMEEGGSVQGEGDSDRGVSVSDDSDSHQRQQPPQAVQGDSDRGVSVSDDTDSQQRQQQQQPPQAVQSDGDVHTSFMFCCSLYTGRVYLFDKDGVSLNANFLPLDVELDNMGELPPMLHHPQHLRLAQHFLRQWNSLTDTKRRLIVKKGLKFHNPLAAYDLVRTDRANNKQRYQTVGDQTKVAMKKAREVNGNIRVLTKRGAPVSLSVAGGEAADNSNESDSSSSHRQGYVQVTSEDGRPLCVHCHQPCTALVSRQALADTTTSAAAAWNTRFCSRVCADAHWMKTNNTYLRSSVYEVQHGVCQLCRFDAHTFFCQIRDCIDRKLRAEQITNSKYCKLANSLKTQMVARPYEGLFWHVDHIRPVYEGGGQCDIDNLRTLCAPCHNSVTAKQASRRAQARRLSKAVCAGDITAFFKKV